MCVLDGLWIGIIAKKFYAQSLGSLMRSHPVWWAAGLFYVLYAAGIIVLVVMPHAGQIWWKVFLYSALLGFIAYMTYDLTSLAITKGFPAIIVGPDIAWGTVATAIAGIVGYFVINAIK